MKHASRTIFFKRDFSAKKPFKKAVTDMSELPAKKGKAYVSAIFDCFDLMPIGLAVDDNMRASLCVQTLDNARKCPAIINL